MSPLVLLDLADDDFGEGVDLGFEGEEFGLFGFEGGFEGFVPEQGELGESSVALVDEHAGVQLFWFMLGGLGFVWGSAGVPGVFVLVAADNVDMLHHRTSSPRLTPWVTIPFVVDFEEQIDFFGDGVDHFEVEVVLETELLCGSFSGVGFFD